VNDVLVHSKRTRGDDRCESRASTKKVVDAVALASES